MIDRTTPEPGEKLKSGLSTRVDNSVEAATKVIAEYARIIGGSFDDAQSLLNRALTKTYEAVCEIQGDPDRLAELLTEKVAGRPTSNPCHPIVRKLWHRVPVRETVSRYSAMIAYAQHQQVMLEDFPNWLSTFKGGIKGAATEWKKLQTKLGGESQAGAKEKVEREAAFLELGEPIALSSEVGEREDGFYLGLIEVHDGNAMLRTVSGQMKSTEIDAFLRRVRT